MSEESSPPQLRLRPRKREDEPAVVPPAPPAVPVEIPPAATQPAGTAPVEPVAEIAPLRFRLKPKLSAEPDATASAAAVDAVTPGLPGPEVVTPPLPPSGVPVVAVSEESASDMPRLKLKPQSPAAAAVAPVPEAMSPAAFPPPIPVLPAMMPAFPVVQPLAPPPMPAAGELAPPMAAPPPLPLPPPIKAPAVVVPAPYKAKTAAKRSKSVMMLAGVVVLLLVVAAGGYFFLFAGNDPEPVAAPVQRPVIPRPVAPPVPIEPLPPPPIPFQTAPSPETVATSSAPLNPVVTPAFRSWVADVRVSGVRSGSSTMAIINGRLARPGDIVDATEGIAFDGVDEKRKALVFRSRNGAFLEKSY